MSFQLLSRKVSVVRESLSEWQLQCLERDFNQAAKSHQSSVFASMAGRGYIFIEFLYAVLRHREWLDVPVFKAIAVEFLQLDHGMPHKASTTLVEAMIGTIKRLGLAKTRTLCVDEREFLNYCYVSAAGVKNDMELEMELGLGTAIIRKLRDGVRVLDEARVDIFIPEYDAMLASIIVELSHQSKTRTWAMDEQRLKYKLLAALGDQAQPWILEESLPSLVEALVEVGKNEFRWTHQPEICEALEKSRLILPDRDGRGRIRGWDLSSDGAALTVNYFKAKHGEEAVANVDVFLAITLTWQVAILQDESLASLSFVMELLSHHLSRMSPLAIETSVSRVVSLGSRVLEPDTLRSLLGAAKLPWHKAAIMRALIEVSPSDELAAVVADSLSVDATGSMMEAAGALLDRWGQGAGSIEG